MTRLAVALLVSTLSLVAQESRPSVCDELASGKASVAEIATRRAMLAPLSANDRACLERLARGPAPSAASAARRVLVRHGLATPEPGLAELSLEARLARAQGSGDAARAARRAVLWCEGELPENVWSTIAPAQRKAWLEALLERPRREARPLLDAVLARDSGAGEAERLLALASLPESELVGERVTEVVRGMTSADAEVFDAACAAAQRFSPGVADSVLGRLVREPETARRPAQVLTTLGARMTEQGEAVVLDFVFGVAPPGLRDEVLSWLDTRGSTELDRRVAAALDAKAPLERVFLERAGKHLDRKERIRRVAELVGSGDRETADLASEVLLRARLLEPELIARADSDSVSRAERWRRILGLPHALLDETLLKKALSDADPEVVVAACRAVADDPAGMRAKLGELLGHPDPQVVGHVRQILLRHGDEACVRRIWESLGADDARAEAALEFSARPRAFLEDLLTKELARLDREGVSTPEAAVLEENLLIALARVGALPARERLLWNLARFSLTGLRKAREALAAGLRPSEVSAILILAGSTTLAKQPQRRSELLRILAPRPELLDVEVLRTMYAAESDEEARLDVLRLLLATPGAESVRARLEPFWSGRVPLTDTAKDEIYEYLGALPLPLSREGLDATLRMLLMAPLATPDAELRGVRGTEVAFPEQTLLAGLLVRSEARAVAEAALRIAGEVRAHPNAFALQRARLVALLGQLAVDQEVARGASPVIAELVLWSPDPDSEGMGIVHLLVGTACEARGDAAGAAEHLSAALAHFAERPLSPRLAARFLGDADPVHESRPIAALGARAHLAAARHAAASGDRARVLRELAMARSLAYGDGASTALVGQSSQELSK